MWLHGNSLGLGFRELKRDDGYQLTGRARRGRPTVEEAGKQGAKAGAE